MRKLACVASSVLALALGGCFAAAVGGAAAVGAYKYAENEATRDYRASFDVAWAATLDAMRELGYAVPAGAAPGPTEGRVSAGDATVVVERHAEGFVRVRVRIGTFETDDHRRRADLLLAGVTRRLGA